ncbi:hypothetical protein CE91St36_20030 [Christensenellaceae bacterium]|nr:hypothetical protein CE91St36_20030 [Christensenellaceae bacterium]BDF61852.1 hypothetical protein CE91St37_20020 [Christensenellaceae bacterium]
MYTVKFDMPHIKTAAFEHHICGGIFDAAPQPEIHHFFGFFPNPAIFADRQELFKNFLEPFGRQ